MSPRSFDLGLFFFLCRAKLLSADKSLSRLDRAPSGPLFCAGSHPYCGAAKTDMLDRGILDDKLVVLVGEFGRRPLISANNAGCEHHSFCNSRLIADG